MKKTATIVIISSFLLMLILADIALAIPAMPNQFYGAVMYNGGPTPDGMKISAKIDGIEMASALTTGGQYSLIVKDQESRFSGKVVYFFADGVDTGKSAVFCNGCVTRADLSVIVQVPAAQSTSSGSGGGGSRSSGASPVSTIPVKTAEEKNASEPITVSSVVSREVPEENVSGSSLVASACVEKWVCTVWNGCENNIRKRKCADKNECGTTESKPFESEPCSAAEKQILGNSAIASPSGFAFIASITEQSNLIIVVAVLILIAAMVLIYQRKKSFLQAKAGYKSGEDGAGPDKEQIVVRKIKVE